MNDRFRRRRKVVAAVAGFALAASITVVAPATASAREVGARQGTVTQVHTGQHPGTSGSTKEVNGWEW